MAYALNYIIDQLIAKDSSVDHEDHGISNARSNDLLPSQLLESNSKSLDLNKFDQENCISYLNSENFQSIENFEIESFQYFPDEFLDIRNLDFNIFHEDQIFFCKLENTLKDPREFKVKRNTPFYGNRSSSEPNLEALIKPDDQSDLLNSNPEFPRFISDPNLNIGEVFPHASNTNSAHHDIPNSLLSDNVSIYQDLQHENEQDSVQEGSANSSPDDLPLSSEGTEEFLQERFWLRRRNEIMFELRNLRLGERPVSDRDRWRLIRNFFRAGSEPEENQDERQVDSNTTRPSEVASEIETLSTLRPVTSALQSQAFRQSLEDNVSNFVARIQYAQNQPLPRSYIATSSAPTIVVNRQPQNNWVREAVNNQDLNLQTANGSAQRTPPSGGQNIQESPVDSQSPTGRGPTPGNHRRRIHGNNFLDRLDDPDLVSEISQLIQHHVVTSALRGEFRGVLERTFSERMASRRVNDGLANAQARRNPVAPTIQRNEAEINLNETTNFRSISSHSTSIDNKLRAMQSEMEEFRRMLRLSMDLQMDVQRSIRQEVAAAFNLSKDSEQATTPAPSSTAMVLEGTCAVCLDQPINTVMYDCGHMCACYQCAYSLKSERRSCPICRAPIKDVIVVYRAN